MVTESASGREVPRLQFLDDPRLCVAGSHLRGAPAVVTPLGSLDQYAIRKVSHLQGGYSTPIDGR